MKFLEGKFRHAKLKTNIITSKQGRICAKLMNNPNPFVPQGSLLELQSRRRSRLKLAVFCVLAVSVTGLVAMLIQGCKRENPDQSMNNMNNMSEPAMDTNPPALELSNPPAMDTNPPVPMAPVESNPPAAVVPPVVVPPPVEQPAAGTEYVVVAGDTLGKIAKAHGVSLKALEAVNPGVDPRKLKVKQKLVIPASTQAADTAPAATAGTVESGGQTYVVKSGDTLTRIARRHHVTLKELRAANHLTTDHIKVGQKLKIPAKGEAAAPAPSPAPAPDTSAPPALPPVQPDNGAAAPGN